MTEFGPKEMFYLLREDIANFREEQHERDKEFQGEIRALFKGHEERLRKVEQTQDESSWGRKFGFVAASTAVAALVSAGVAGMVT